MNIVTVTCDRDIHLALLQAHSINKFLSGSHTHWVIIENSTRAVKDWEDLFCPWYTNHNLRLVQGKDLILCNHLPGYIRQQILKFVISEKINSENYLILDSKDILLRNTSLDEWGSEEGNNLIYKPFNTASSIEEILAPELKIYSMFANMTRKIVGADIPSWFWAPATPFRCKTQNVKALLSSMDVSSVFDPYVTNIREVSEFVIYRFFSDFQNNLESTEENHWTTGNNTKFMWPNADIEIDLRVIRDDFYKSVSFHRWYIANNARRIDKLIDVLVNEIGLDENLTKNALDGEFWTVQTEHEKGHNLFDQFDVGHRLKI
jgi:hypothetical protein